MAFFYAIPRATPCKKKGTLLLHNLFFTEEKKKAVIRWTMLMLCIMEAPGIRCQPEDQLTSLSFLMASFSFHHQFQQNTLN